MLRNPDSISYFTTMNFDVYREFGWRLIETFDRYSDQGARLIVYSEDRRFVEFLEASTLSNVVVRALPDTLERFLAGIRGKSQYVGIRRRLKISNLRNTIMLKGVPRFELSSYDFLFDARRFSFKAFAWVDALKSVDGVVIYLDADCHFFRSFDQSDFAMCEGCDIGFFGRKTYTETGFVYFNNKDFRLRDLGSSVESCYLTGEIFKLAAYTDCHVFDHCRRMFADALVLRSLGDENDSHPIARSWLSNFMDHRKGKRKQLKQSPELLY